ncbi:UL38 capsid triplex subunit 1 [Leporid alphaherpesvirus 4]|uniref:UL38 capsid triplex subunit 1 n=1 Tax=Leporid alphaherpesvirus 4 TaxID=481315 RepID=J9QWL8_9ALPH|nr:UL38 capsid triplex subunit 1 [Leporid alphaherpesvirus 4]AFR32479.1 UL38 capsid triplex subunit 1 [Leporid alphaherpesvirus 4]
MAHTHGGNVLSFLAFLVYVGRRAPQSPSAVLQSTPAGWGSAEYRPLYGRCAVVSGQPAMRTRNATVSSPDADSAIRRVLGAGHRGSVMASARVSASTLWLLGASRAPGGRDAPAAEQDGLEHVLDKVWGMASRMRRAAPAPTCRLTRHVTLTDMIQPNADGAGSIVLTMRHFGDYPHLARQRAPPGRNVERVAEALGRLMELSSAGTLRADVGGTRAGLVSLNFLVAACSDAYDARDAAAAARAHVIANYRGPRTAARLDQFAACLRALVHTHVFPHELIGVLGGLTSWVTQDELASVTAVASGAQGAAPSGAQGRPRSSVCVPDCAFIDLDAEFGTPRRGAAFLYLVLAYGQRNGQEMCRVHVVKTHAPRRGIEAFLERLFGRLRVMNTIHGIEDMDAPLRAEDADFPLMQLSRTDNAPRCSASEAMLPRLYGRLHQWRPDLRGRPTANTATYAAYAMIGTMPEDAPRVTQRVERFGSVSVPVALLEGVVWCPGEWTACA